MNIRTAALMRGAVAMLALGLATTACGVSADPTPGTTTAAGPVTGLKIMVPNSPGSGYDTTARAASKAIEDAGLARASRCSTSRAPAASSGCSSSSTRRAGRVPHADGPRRGRRRLHEQEQGHADGHHAGRPPDEPRQRPSSYPRDRRTSPCRSWGWRGRPTRARCRSAEPRRRAARTTSRRCCWRRRSVSTPKDVNYVSYDGGGELLAGILGRKVAFAATGVGEVAEQAKAGEVKILAVTSEEPVEGVDAPTLKEPGVDMVFTNWRGIVAPAA